MLQSRPRKMKLWRPLAPQSHLGTAAGRTSFNHMTQHPHLLMSSPGPAPKVLSLEKVVSQPNIPVQYPAHLCHLAWCISYKWTIWVRQSPWQTRTASPYWVRAVVAMPLGGVGQVENQWHLTRNLVSVVLLCNIYSWIDTGALLPVVSSSVFSIMESSYTTVFVKQCIPWNVLYEKLRTKCRILWSTNSWFLEQSAKSVTCSIRPPDYENSALFCQLLCLSCDVFGSDIIFSTFLCQIGNSKILHIISASQCFPKTSVS